MSSVANGTAQRLIPQHSKKPTLHEQPLVPKSNTGAGMSPEGSPHNQSSASCTLCRRRKVKCDRKTPCRNCLRSGADCVPHVPSRAPRGRQGGRKRRGQDGELLERISKLEGLIRDIEGHDAAPGGNGIAVLEGINDASTISAHGGPMDVAIPSAPQDRLNRSSGAKTTGNGRKPSVQGLDRYLGSSFWVILTEEINGLKGVLGSSSDDEDEGDDEQTPPSNIYIPGQQQQQHSSHSGFVICRSISEDNPIHPNRHQVYTFCEIYLANIDPVFKVLHAPSLRRYLQEGAAELDCSSGPGGREALRFAIYYAATVSMANDECKHRTGEDKAILLARYRAGTELGLAKADFVNSVEMSTLQALSIYLVSVRALDNSRLVWTLTSLAIRIAQAMGLHLESRLVSFQPFEREMRRRLWWQICNLDSRAAEDRASPAVVSGDSFTTKLPLRINDEDLHFGSSEDFKEQEGYTEMTFGLICNEVFDTIRQLNHVPARELGQPQDGIQENWSQRRDKVVNLQRYIEHRYLRYLNLARPFHWATRMVADVISAGLWLLIYRPLERRPRSASSLTMADPGILSLSVEVLEKIHQLNTDPASSNFKWMSQTYVQWHPIAVTTAELCVKSEGPMVERAWAILEPVYLETAKHVADSDKGMLWRPIKKLMARAQGVRRKYLDSHSAVADPSAKLATLNTSHQGNTLATTEDAMFDFNDYMPEKVDAIPHPMEAIQQKFSVPAALPFHWDPWLAAETISTTAQSQHKTDMCQMAWMNWEDFVDDFQGQDNVMSGTSCLAPGSSHPWLL